MPDKLTDEERLEHSSIVWKKVRVHTHAPVHMDRGRTDISHKCSALAWTWRHECSSLASLFKFQASYRFMITDLGTESGVADFRAVDGVQGLLPDWREDGWVADADASPGLHPQHFLPDCLRALGMCHMLSNLDRDVDKHLVDWEWFYERLHNASCLLGAPSLRKLFVEKCVMVHARCSHERLLFEEHKVDRIYEKRWEHAIGFMRKSRRHLIIMRATWDEAAFCAGFSSAEKEFSPRLMTEALRSNKFFALLEAILKLHELPGRLRGWSGGCPCHEPLQVGRRRHDRAREIEAALGGQGRHCPMQTMRFPELVGGRLLKLQESLGAAAAAELVVDLSVHLSPADMASVLNNFETGRAGIAAGLMIKTAFTQTLPFVLGGLAHWDPSVASRFAGLAESAWESTPPEQRSAHHRFTTKVFEDQALRAQLRLHMQGAIRLGTHA